MNGLLRTLIAFENIKGIIRAEKIYKMLKDLEEKDVLVTEGKVVELYNGECYFEESRSETYHVTSVRRDDTKVTVYGEYLDYGDTYMSGTYEFFAHDVEKLFTGIDNEGIITINRVHDYWDYQFELLY